MKYSSNERDHSGQLLRIKNTDNGLSLDGIGQVIANVASAVEAANAERNPALPTKNVTIKLCC